MELLNTTIALLLIASPFIIEHIQSLAMSKTRRKFSSQSRRARFVNRWLIGIRLIARNSAGLNPDGEPTLEIIHSNGSDAASTARTMEHELLHWQHHWLITAFVECQSEDGTKYIESTEFEAYGVKINDLAELVQPELEAVQKRVNHKHIVDHGWQAEIKPSRKHERKAA